MVDLCALSALALGAAIQRGEVSREAALQAALARIGTQNSDYNAFLTVDGWQADGTSPLAGVPMALKDNICTKGLKTTCASRILDGFVPPYDATVVRRLKDAGATLVGKLNMDEFGMGSTSETSAHGPVRNPWSMCHSAGGSSGGVAAAVAARMCWYALGSDTGGSLRQPAAHCGVTGLKPTYGSVSRYGLVAYASSMDQIGPIAQSAADCAAVLDLIAGPDERDATCIGHPRPGSANRLDGDLRGLTIGIPEECFTDGLNPALAQGVLEAGKVLEGRGASVKWFSLQALKYAVPAYYVLACAEASSNLARYDGVGYGRRAEQVKNLDDLYVKSRTEGFGAEAKRRILLGTFVLSDGFYDTHYRRALQGRNLVTQGLKAALNTFDLLLTPVTPDTAPMLGESLQDPLGMYLLDLYTVPANLAGLPALSMPCGFAKNGLPMGAQLIGPAFGEPTLLNAAHAHQLDTDWHLRRPEGGREL